MLWRTGAASAIKSPSSAPQPHHSSAFLATDLSISRRYQPAAVWPGFPARASAYTALGIIILLALLITACGGGEDSNPLTSYTGPVPGAASLRLGRGAIHAIAFTTSGDSLLVGSGVGLALHRADTLADVWQLAAPSPVDSVAVSPNGMLIAAGLEDGTTLIVDATNGNLLEQIPAPVEDVVADSVAFTTVRDGVLRLAIGFNDGVVGLVNIATGNRLMVEQAGALSRLEAGASALAYSPDGAMLATGDRSGAVRLWNAQTGAPLAELGAHQANTAVLSLAWSTDGATLVSAGHDGQTLLWNVPDGEVVEATSPVNSPVLMASFDAKGTLITAAESGAVAVGNVDSQSTAEAIIAAALSPEGTLLAIGNQDGALTLWPITDGALAATPARVLAGYTAPDTWATAVTYHPDGDRLAAASGEVVAIWDAVSGERLRTLDNPGEPITALAWSPGGRRIAGGSRDDSVIIWDALGGRIAHRLEGHDDVVASVAWSPDGTRLASAGSLDDQIMIWDARSGDLLGTLDAHSDGVWGVAWSSDGESLATGTTSGDVLLWDLSEGIPAEPYDVLVGHMAWASSVAWSPDGQYVAAGSGDATVMLWNLTSGHRLDTLAGHDHVVRSVAFSPDGNRLASGSQDRTVIVWDVTAASYGAATPLEGHTGRVNNVAFAPDGVHVASGSDDGTVLIWDIRH